MSDLIKGFSLELILILTVIIVIVPTIIVGLIRHSLYQKLNGDALTISRLLTNKSRGIQPSIVNKLEARFIEASEKLEQVNTMALIDGLYSQEKFSFFGRSLRYEKWDYICSRLPNLLLAFGLLGTFIGISLNLYSLSQTISETGTGADSLNKLVEQLQIPLKNMGIAFITSLIAIACSSILIILNSIWNTGFAKSCLISSLEDYLDNIYKINIQGDTRLDKAVDRMVKQQQEFLTRFHEKVGQVLENTLGDAANKMVTANQGFQNNVDSMVSRFNDISSSIAASTDSFQESASNLNQQIKAVEEIVPQFTSSAELITAGSALYLEGAEKIKKSKFSENLENITSNLADTYQSFSQSTAFLGNQVHKISETHQQTAELAQQVYNHLQTASHKLQDSSLGFIEAAESFKQSDFADKLTTATAQLTTIPQQFNESTAILHQSTDNLGKAIDNISTSTHQTNSLIERVNSLNQNSTQLLEQSDRNMQQEITQLNRMVNVLSQHKEQINSSIGNFGARILTSFKEQTDHSIVELQNLNTGIENSSRSFQLSQIEIAKLIAEVGKLTKVVKLE